MQASTRPEAVCVEMHQGDKAERVEAGWWIVTLKPVGSRGWRSEVVRMQERERIVSVPRGGGERPVI